MDEKQENRETQTYTIEGDLTIYRVAELREGLAQFAAASSSVVVDLQGVSECDAAGLQLLVSLKKTAEENGKEFLFMNSPDSVAELIKAIGLEAVFSVN